MPLFKIQETEQLQLAIWDIQEEETFFSRQTGLVASSKWEHRRLEFQASRYLLRLLQPSFPLETIQLSEYGKPFFPSNHLHFSITHSFPYVGVAIAKHSVGIDVQTYQEKIASLQQKFLSESEQRYFENDIRKITLAWAAKEAVFKWSEIPGIDFIKHMPIRHFHYKTANEASIEITFEKTKPARPIALFGGMEANFGWMVTIPENKQ